MLKHVVCWKLADADADADADAALAEREQKVSTIVTLLRSLTNVVPSIRSLSVGPAVLSGPNFWDICLVIDFDDVEGLQAYQVHPEHQAVSGRIRALVIDRAVVDFQV